MHALTKRESFTVIPPLVCNHFSTPDRSPQDTIRFSVSCFAGDNWSLKNMYEPQDAYRDPELAERLSRAFVGVGAKKVYAPTPVKFNGEITYRRKLSTAIHLPQGVSLHRNSSEYADGTFLSDRGDAGAFSAGGCGIVLATYGDNLLFAHAGRESILDRTEVLTEGNKRSREYDLIDNILAVMGATERSKLHLWPLYFIGPDEFVHHKDDPNPAHAPYNRSAMQYLPRKYPGEFGWVTQDAVGIDLPKIFRAQCVAHGVPAGNVHLGHADLNKELPTTRKGGGRYLVVAVRNS